MTSHHYCLAVFHLPPSCLSPSGMVLIVPSVDTHQTLVSQQESCQVFLDLSMGAVPSTPCFIQPFTKSMYSFHSINPHHITLLFKTSANFSTPTLLSSTLFLSLTSNKTDRSYTTGQMTGRKRRQFSCRDMLKVMVESSMAQCRRDFLWNRMLIGIHEEGEGRRKHRSEPSEEARVPVSLQVLLQRREHDTVVVSTSARHASALISKPGHMVYMV